MKTTYIEFTCNSCGEILETEKEPDKKKNHLIIEIRIDKYILDNEEYDTYDTVINTLGGDDLMFCNYDCFINFIEKINKRWLENELD